MSRHEVVKYRSYLFSVAYNILGEIEESEDIVQDVFEYYLTRNPAEIQNLRSWLTRVVANKSIDRLRQLQVARRGYPGTWLPEPCVYEEGEDPDNGILAYETLCVLEQLNPVERAVFVLRESFNLPYNELSEICGISPDNCRQVLSRVKKKIGLPPSHLPANPLNVTGLVESFLKACLNGDISELSSLLKDDIVLNSDGGGKAKAAVNPLYGNLVVSKFLAGVVRKGLSHNPAYRLVNVNGSPAILTTVQNKPYSLLYPDLSVEGVIGDIYILRNPDKLKRLGRFAAG